MHGRFVRGDGLILPNNVSLAGAEMILVGAFRLTPQALYACLVSGAPSKSMTMAQMIEPTLGVGGYERIAIPQTIVGWPTIGTLSGEKYIESDWLTFAADEVPFDQPIQRVALVAGSAYAADAPVFALSAALPEAVTIDVDTPLDSRRFKYQFFL